MIFGVERSIPWNIKNFFFLRKYKKFFQVGFFYIFWGCSEKWARWDWVQYHRNFATMFSKWLHIWSFNVLLIWSSLRFICRLNTKGYKWLNCIKIYKYVFMYIYIHIYIYISSNIYIYIYIYILSIYIFNFPLHDQQASS